MTNTKIYVTQLATLKSELNGFVTSTVNDDDDAASTVTAS